ncbi:hypothetical protein CDD83_2004 [Cordyceps sp. RAO-2017]|nr:hypothetical protein CDD83_2004 [Cordyceps sp. RAO-2017]
MLATPPGQNSSNPCNGRHTFLSCHPPTTSAEKAGPAPFRTPGWLILKWPGRRRQVRAAFSWMPRSGHHLHSRPSRSRPAGARPAPFPTPPWSRLLLRPGWPLSPALCRMIASSAVHLGSSE